MIRVFFGKPGVGKTTLCCKLAKIASKTRPAYINFRNTVPNVHSCDTDGLGEWSFQKGSYIALDEAGIDFNNRAYKAMKQATIRWFKKHRHYKCDIDVFSQSWEDMDVTLRRLANELWYMVKLGPFTLCRRVYKRVTVDKQTEQIIDGYRMASVWWFLLWPVQYIMRDFKWTLTFRPFYYRYFDSWECDDLSIREFPVLCERKQNNYFVAFVCKVRSALLSLFSKLTK